MIELDEEDFDDPDGDFRHFTKWAVLVGIEHGDWIITRVTPGCEIGDYPMDNPGNDQEYRVGAFFDPTVEKILNAMTLISGNSIEGNSQIECFLSGTCRSFLEAMVNLEEWKKKPTDP